MRSTVGVAAIARMITDVSCVTKDEMDVSSAPDRGEVSQVVAGALARLSPAERRVADVVLRDPQGVAFGTVAEVARRARTSGPSVVRLAGRLGYEGFVGLQAAVRRDLGRRLRPAVERVRAKDARGDLLTRTLETEIANVRLTLQAVDARVFDAAVARLASPKHRVTVLPSEQARGIGALFAGELGIVRDGVRLAGGSEFRLVTQLARLRRDDTVVLMDLRRHERWLVEAARRIAAAGAARIVIVDSDVSPLADGALAVLRVEAESAGPFDSHVGMLALVNALLAGVAARRRPALTRRLDTLERTWVSTGALVSD
jgi:DNA-binding MurR/RpiR family transcriptional regulator